MLQLRKILLLDKIYIIIFLIVIVISIIRLNINNKSIYTSKTTTATGIITNINNTNDKYTIYLKSKENLLVKYYSKKKISLSLGDKIIIKGEFYKPHNNSTKYLFNYKKYLKRKNINYIVNAHSIKKINSNKNIYYYIKQKIINNLGNNPYLYIFLIGDKSLVNRESIRSYQENGISHLFAISGMHITLLSSIISKLLRKLTTEENTFKITSIILTFYLLIVGLAASILRGVLFYILFGINKIYYFYIKPINLFLLIISVSLLINPNYIFDVGFEYSYLISFSLLSLSDMLKSNNYFISLLKVSVLSFISSIPITLYNFYQLNILSIIYNLFFVPFISIIIFPLSLVIVLFKPFEFIYNYLIKILENTSIFLSHINVGKITFMRLPLIIYLTYFILIILYLIFKRKSYMYILFVILLFHFFLPYFKNDTLIHFTDVGQGDSTLIHQNNNNILIDTGGIRNNEIFFNTTFPFLKSLGIAKINTLIITHGDYDHMGEAINLVNNFKVEKVIFNCGEFNNLESELIKLLDKKKIKYYSCIKELNIDKNKLYFLQTKEYDNENDNSNVIYTELNEYKFMFMGDASSTTEKEILNKYNLPNIDVLKVGHHGSKTSSSNEFINEINPKYSIISVGKNNRYGHPNKEVLNNLKDSKIYRTDKDGSIMFKISNKLKIETCSP